MNYIVEELARKEATYQPGAEVAERLQALTIAPLIGPVAVGKSTCMDYVVSIDDEFGRVQSFTTRPQREREGVDEYRFIPHSQTTLQNIAYLARDGQLVQYAVHPTTRYIYGSELSDYKRPYMLLDTLASTVGTIRQLPYGKIKEISVVTEPEEWKKRFLSRNTPADEAAKRLLEGVYSLEWSLEQGTAMAWICTPVGTGELPQVAREIRSIIKGEEESNPKNRKIAERLLATLQRLRA